MGKILIIEDDPFVRRFYKKLFEEENLTIYLAVNGDEGVAKAKEIIPDIVLMDIMMPGTPAREEVRKIKTIKIAYLSVVRTSEAEKEELLGQKNIVDFIQKPFDIKDFIKRVKKIVG